MPTEAPTWEDTLPEPSWDDTEPFQAEPVEINEDIRNLPNQQLATRGGPRVSLPDMEVARATFQESLSEGAGNVVTHPGIDLPSFAPSLETVQKAMDVTRAASDYETSGTIPNVPTEPSKPTTAAKVITGGIEGVDELARGVVNFFTSGPGVLQLAAARTPLAPAVYAKWTIDMLNAGFTSAQDAWEAFQKSDYRKGAKDAAVAFGSFLGAGAAAKHGYKELAPVIDAVPRGDLRGVKVEEAQQKALEATMPPQDGVSPLAQRIEPEPTIPLTRTRELEQSAVVKKTPQPLGSKENPLQVKLEKFKLPAGLGSGYAVRWAEPYLGRQLTVASGFKTEAEAAKWVEENNATPGREQYYIKSELPKTSVNPDKSLGMPSPPTAEVVTQPKMEAVAEQAAASNLPKAKEPWEMTREEYWNARKVQHREYNFAVKAHASLVRTAINQGKPVPPEVLKDYPDLQPANEGVKKGEENYERTPDKPTGPNQPTEARTEGSPNPADSVREGVPLAEVSGLGDLRNAIESHKSSPQGSELPQVLESYSRKAPWEITQREAINLGESVPELMKARNRAAAKAFQNKSDPNYKASQKAFALARELAVEKLGIRGQNYNQGRGLDSQQLAERLSAKQAADYHRKVIEKAIKDGKHIPAEVLRDYPDLPQSSLGQPTPKIEGMGGAIPEEFRPSQSLPTANKNASIDADRVARGEAPLMSAMRKSDPELWDQAMRVVENDWQAADKLIGRHRSEPFVPTDTELIVLLHRRTDLKNDFAKLSREYARAIEEGRPEMAEAAKGSRDAILDQLRELEAIVGKGDTAMGTMAGRALRARRLAMNEDFSMASLIVDREAALKRKLTPEELTELEKISQDQAKASEALAKKEAELEARAQEIEAKEIAARAAADATADAPSPYVIKLVESIVKDWDSRADRARARLREKMARTSAGVDPTILVDLSEIGLSHLGHAGLNFAKWSTRMLADVGEWAKPHLEEVFRRSQKLAETDVEKRAGPKKEAVKKAIGQPTPIEAIDGIVTRVGKRFAKNPNLDFSMAARKIARYYVEQGITKPLELVDAVHAKLVEVMPELTKRETMDALSFYGRFIPLKKDAVSVALRDATGQMLEIAKLEDMAAGIPPQKTGHERPVPSDERRRYIKQVEAKKKEGGYDVTDPETQLRTAMQAAERRLNNQIADLVHQIETREKIVKNKRKLELDDNLKALRDKRDFLKEVYDEVFAPAPLTEAQRLAKWKERTQAKIAEYRERLSERDFKPRKRPEPPRLDREAIDLRYELHKVHNALMQMRLKDELKQRTRAAKIIGGIANVTRFQRALMTTGEFSAYFRQGGALVYSNPIIATKALAESFSAFRSEKNQFRIMEEIQTRENAPKYESSGLQFTESGVRLSTMEELYMFRVAEALRKVDPNAAPAKRAMQHVTSKTVGVVAAFQRAFVTFLNKLRADVFDVLADRYGNDPKTLKDIAEYINIATGRGSKGVGRFVGPGANTIFFAPRYAISRLQFLAGQPYWGAKTKAGRKMAIHQYARTLSGAAVVYSLGLLAGWLEGQKPEETLEIMPMDGDFGKVKIGNTRIDPLFGLLQWTRFLAREGTGLTINSKGKVRPLREGFRLGGKLPPPQPFEPGGMKVATDFTVSKLAPYPGMAARFIEGKQYGGKPFSLKDEIINAHFPMTYGDVYDAMVEQGVPKGTAMAILAIFGMGVQTYDANAKRKE